MPGPICFCSCWLVLPLQLDLAVESDRRRKSSAGVVGRLHGADARGDLEVGDALATRGWPMPASALPTDFRIPPTWNVQLCSTPSSSRA
jgi:hypothetical protein